MSLRPATRPRRAILQALIAGAFPAALRAEDDPIAIVVRPDVPADNLSLPELRRLMLGDREYWSSDLRVTLLVRTPAGRERDVVLKTVYQMTEEQFRQYWIDKVFRAAAGGPRILYSQGIVAELAVSIPGAVAFVTANHVPSGLKVLRIDGRLPQEQGYPLR